jgi:integrase
LRKINIADLTWTVSKRPVPGPFLGGEQRCGKSVDRRSAREKSNYEHSTNVNSADYREIANDRRCVNHNKPNTAPFAQRSIQTTRILNGGRGRAADRGGTQTRPQCCRDAAAILLAYRHGLRAVELCQLRWSQIDLRHGRLHVNRAKGGIESVHPLHGPELRGATAIAGEQARYVFVTQAGSPVTTAWFLRMVQRTGNAAKLAFPVHPHMLRHSTGYKLANDGQDTRSLAHYFGHRNMQSTARYTALAPMLRRCSITLADAMARSSAFQIYSTRGAYSSTKDLVVRHKVVQRRE